MDMDFRELTPGCALDDFHYGMWGGCMEFLIANEEVRSLFEKETGTPAFSPPRSGIEAMIDSACGVDGESYVAVFCRWATPNYWGDDTYLCPAIIAKLGVDPT